MTGKNETELLSSFSLFIIRPYQKIISEARVMTPNTTTAALLSYKVIQILVSVFGVFELTFGECPGQLNTWNTPIN